MRLIDADDFGNRMYHEVFEKDSEDHRWDSGCWMRYKLFEKVLREQPEAQPDLSSYSDKLWRNAYERGKAEAQPHRMPGRWIDRNGNIVSPFWERYECSECGARSDNTNYCPNCGAKMENGGENRMRWERTGREVKANGESTTTYTSHDPEGWTIESRKRMIPHANGIGSWAHTEFFLIRPDGTETEHWALRDAKAVAETEAPE